MVLPEAREDAFFERVKLSRSAARSTLARVAGVTLSTPRNARETVAWETPASFATSAMVARAMIAPFDSYESYRLHHSRIVDFSTKHAEQVSRLPTINVSAIILIINTSAEAPNLSP